jgi:hypothetical protein
MDDKKPIKRNVAIVDELRNKSDDSNLLTKFANEL